MIPVALIFMALQAAFALCTVVGYQMTTVGKAQRGHLLIGIGSAGLVLAAPNPVYQVLSLYWTWIAARAYQKCYLLP